MIADSKGADPFQELYATLTEKELKQSQAGFRRYLEIVWEIQKQQSLEASNGKVDSSNSSLTMEERSNIYLKK